MPDGSTAADAGEAAVRHQSASGVQAHASNGASGREHFTHTRTALGTLIAHNNNVARLHLTGVQTLTASLLAVKALGGAGVHHHLWQDRALLHHCAVGRQIAVQDCQTAGLGVGVLPIPNNVIVLDLRLHDAISPSTIHRSGGGINKSHAIQALHDGTETTSNVQIRQAMHASRIQLHKMGHRVRNSIDAL